MIPKILHYTFGMSADHGRKPWSLVNYVCLRSAIEQIKPTAVFFHCESEPVGPWWDISRPLVSVQRIKAPRDVFGNPLLHEAHRADVVRLQKLLEIGGIYLDPDVFVHRSFDDLLTHSAVLGEQRFDGKISGLCNAVILAEQQSPFLKRWFSEYKSFRSRGWDEYWDEHSVRVPYRLAKQFPQQVTILPYDAFFWPSFTPEDLTALFASPEPIDLSRSYAVHLWQSIAWDRYLEHLTPRRVRKRDTNFHRWASPMIEGLPNDYGSPTWTARLARWSRHTTKRLGSVPQRMRRLVSHA